VNYMSSLAWPKICIITPSFNQGHFIEATIQSVLGQGYPDLEYIVIDGGSTDDTIEILKKYQDQLKWVSEKDRGQSDAINKGFRQATGDVVALINSDDTYTPGAFHAVGEYFARHPETYWLTGWCHTIDVQGNEIRQAVTAYKKFWLLWRSYRVLQVLDYISQPATFWRKEVIEKIGPFDERLHYAMDYDYSLRVGKQYKLSVLPRYLANFRIHPSSKAGASAHAQFDADLEIARSHTSSSALLKLHHWHNALVVRIYRWILARSP
jgi:glycosyltransferase involved in cell wall biosynthesis